MACSFCLPEPIGKDLVVSQGKISDIVPNYEGHSPCYIKETFSS